MSIANPTESHFSYFKAFLEEENYASAFQRAEAYFLQPIDNIEELQTICSLFQTFLPRLSQSETETLLEIALKTLRDFPSLKKEQAEVLILYGDLFIEKPPDFPNLLTAMRSYATAYTLDPTKDRLEQLWRPLIPLILDGFRGQVQKAAGRGDVESFTRLLSSFHEKFCLDRKTSQELYYIVENIYQDLNPNTKARFSNFLTEIENGKSGKIPLRESLPPIVGYLERLEKIRSQFEGIENAPSFQKEISGELCKFFSLLLEDVIFILGKPPCKYDIRVTGSLAKKQVCPYSDLEYYILIEDIKYLPFFQKLAQFFELQILALGESDPKYQNIFDFGQKRGLEIDHQSNPAYSDSLIGTPETLFAPHDSIDPDDLKAYRSRLCSISLHANHAFDIPKGESANVLLLLEMRKAEFKELAVLNGGETDIKREFIEPIIHFIGDLSLYYSLEEKNTLDQIDHLPLFDEKSKTLLKRAVASLYLLRVRLHMESQGIQELASLEPSLDLPVLTEVEKKTLNWIHHLVLTPLYKIPLGECDLLEIAFQTPSTEVVELATEFLTEVKSPLKLHQFYYKKLNAPTHVDLQMLYLQRVPEFAEILSEIPNRAGFRQSRRRKREEFLISLQEMTTTEATSRVKITWPRSEGVRYLTSDAAKELFKSDGHLRQEYPKSRHSVCRYGNFHFKELPDQPLMERAVDSLMHRIVGEATPETILARIEFLDNGLVYPILISETIEGDEISPEVQLLGRHLTLMRLCEILIKPGDGRLANYVVNMEGRVYSVDNEMAFFEPLQRSFMGHQVVFRSTLFTLDQELDVETLRGFCSLEPDLIILDWLRELQKEERVYLDLFPNQTELQKFYEEDSDRRFSPGLLLAKGTIANLYMQFRHLQEVLRNEPFRNPLRLLREIVTLLDSEKNPTGQLLEKAYQKALDAPFPKRLEIATSSPADQSMTSSQALELSLLKIPTFEEIQGRKAFSIEEALNELLLLVGECHIGQDSGEEYSIQVDLSSVLDPDREKLILDALISILNSKGNFPHSITIRHSRSLRFEDLILLLHPGLRFLDLSYGSLAIDFLTINLSHGLTSALSQIEKLAPNLEELHLEGCTGLSTPTISLPNLKKLNVSNCPNLRLLRVKSPLLEELKLNRCSKIMTLDVRSQNLAHMECEEIPRLRTQSFSELLYNLGMRYVEENPELALSYLERARLSGHHGAREIIHCVEELKNKTKYSIYGAQKVKVEALALRMTDTIKVLEVPEVDFKDRLNDSEVFLLAEYLKKTKSLISFKLCVPRSISDQTALALADVIKVNTSLKTLCLVKVGFGNEGAYHLAKALCENHSISHFSYNHDYGGGVFADVLKVNNSLEILGLSYRGVGNSGAIEIGEALMCNSSLVFLFMRENSITDQGAAFVAKGLQNNRFLIQMNLFQNNIGFGGAESLIEALQKNFSLTQLDLRYNKLVREDQLKKIEELLWRNQGLQTSAFEAAKQGEEQLFDLLDQGVSPYGRDPQRNSFLHILASHGHTHMISKLLTYSHNRHYINWRNSEDKTALELANNEEIEEILMNYNPEWKTPNSD